MMKSLIKFSTLLPLSIFLFANSSPAAMLEYTLSDKKIEGHLLATSATAALEGSKIALTEVGSGIRTKKVLFVNVQVYLGELLASDAATFNKADLLNSAAAQKAVAIKMTFLRGVDSKKIMNSFEESFKANNVDSKDPEIAKLIDAVSKGGDIEKGQSLSVLGYKKDKAEVVVLEDARGKTTEVTGGEGLIRKVFSLWLGKPGDSGVEAFQKALLK